MAQSIRHTPELSRILALPRRRVDDFPEEYVERLTDLLKTPNGTWKLRPAQALALHDIGVHGGAFCILGVGQGKTIVTLLAPYVLNAKRPMLLAPAGLLKKTERDRLLIEKHFRVPTNIRLFSYELLGRVQSVNELENYKPDLLMLDEGHRGKNRRAAMTRRLLRFMQSHPETKVVDLSGTSMRTSILELHHRLLWCLKDRAPIPRTVEECEEWALALDEKVSDEARYLPGALLKLCADEDYEGGASDVVAVRRGYRRRLLETPGVVSAIAGGEVVDAGLTIRAITYDVSKTTDRHFRTLRGDPEDRENFPGWFTPDGWALSQPVDVWRHARELALGLHYAWDPRPPEDWRNARRDWAAFVREVLSRSRTLDSELQVANACDAGKLDATALNRWRAVKDTFKPNSVAVWHDDSALKVCAEWMKTPGIVWTEHAWFAERLSEVTGSRYFGAKGLAADGVFIDDASAGEAIIASIDANKEGRNLQKWHRNLVVSMQDGADVMQQLIGRTHRTGQEEDVTVDILLGCREHANAMRKALAAAEAVRDTTGEDSKLLMADLDWPSDAAIASFRGWRWGINS